MTADEFRQWMDEHGYSVRRLAATLDVDPTTIQNYRSGRRRIPQVFEMALESLERRADE